MTTGQCPPDASKNETKILETELTKERPADWHAGWYSPNTEPKQAGVQ